MTDLDRVTDLFEKWAAEENEHRQAGEYGLAEGLRVAIEDLRAAVHGGRAETTTACTCDPAPPEIGGPSHRPGCGEAETTTATDEGTLADALGLALADYEKEIERAERSTTVGPAIAVQAGASLAAAVRGLLATARTRPTETEWRVRYPDGDRHRISEAVARDPWPLVEGAVVERREVTDWTEADQ